MTPVFAAMDVDAVASTSTVLFDVALALYVVAMVLMFFELAFTAVTADAETFKPTRSGKWAGRVGDWLVYLAVVLHLVSIVARAIAAGRYPLGNMYEYGSMLAFFAVVFGVAVVRRRWSTMMPFVLVGAVLMMVSAVMLFTEAGPVVPALESIWLSIHVSAMVLSAAVFMISFVANVLYLVKEHAERRSAACENGTVKKDDAEDLDGDGETVSTTTVSTTVERDAMALRWFIAVPLIVTGVFVGVVSSSALYGVTAGAAAALVGTAVWLSIPVLPTSDVLDNVSYRITAFGFPVLTFGVICGAIWAEAAWGRYWGWDPKETGSFVTWVLYAAYLHARATRGWRGRRAAWVGVAAFASLMVTYFVVNLVVVGLHSYAQ